MKNVTFIRMAEIWILFAAICQAQTPTPAIPSPLAPPSDQASVQNAGNTSSVAAVPDSGYPANDNSKVASPGQTSPVTTHATASTSDSTKTPTLTAATLSSMDALDDKIPLEAGDTISMRVIQDRDQAVSRVVTDTGEVEFLYIGRLKVEGKTCHEVAVEAKRLLEANYYKHATVIVGLDLIAGEDKTKPRDFVWVTGEVRQTGPVELSKNQPITVSQIIIRSGGFTDFANQRNVRLMHRNSPSSEKNANDVPNTSNPKDSQTVDVKAVLDGKSAVDPVVKANDYIVVSRSIF